MLEGLWLRLMMGVDDITREKAHQAAIEHVVAIFPKHFTPGRCAGRRKGVRGGLKAFRKQKKRDRRTMMSIFARRTV
jgi:hypothetical protein